MMKVIVLSGFLGAGKTSLLLQLARVLIAGNNGTTSPVAIIENEIGRVSIDSATLSGQGLEYRELISGCVCCSIAGTFEETLKELEEKMQPTWLVIEATGLAYPDKLTEAIVQTISDLESIITFVLVDAARFHIFKEVTPLVTGQIVFADVILLNKVDLVTNEEKDEILDCLRDLNPGAELSEIVACREISHTVLTDLVKGLSDATA